MITYRKLKKELERLNKGDLWGIAENKRNTVRVRTVAALLLLIKRYSVYDSWFTATHSTCPLCSVYYYPRVFHSKCRGCPANTEKSVVGCMPGGKGSVEASILRQITLPPIIHEDNFKDLVDARRNFHIKNLRNVLSKLTPKQAKQVNQLFSLSQ